MSEARAILVADDEQGFRDLFTFALEPLGFRVVAVSDGAEAVAQVAMRPFDLVVLDDHMPHLNGLEALRQIHLLVPELPVVMMSGSAEHPKDFETQAMQLGAACCLFKPIELQPLLQAVETHSTRRS